MAPFTARTARLPPSSEDGASMSNRAHSLSLALLALLVFSALPPLAAAQAPPDPLVPAPAASASASPTTAAPLSPAARASAITTSLLAMQEGWDLLLDR